MRENRLALLFVLSSAIFSVQCFAQGSSEVLSLPVSAVMTNVAVARDWLEAGTKVVAAEVTRSKDTQRSVFTRIARLPSPQALDIRGMEQQIRYLDILFVPIESMSALWAGRLETYQHIGRRVLKGEWKSLALSYQQARPIVDTANTWTAIITALRSRKVLIVKVHDERLSREPEYGR